MEATSSSQARRKRSSAEVEPKEPSTKPRTLPSSLKKTNGPRDSKRRKRRVNGQGICFSPHLVEVHEFHQGSPAKRRMDYRKRHVDEIDESQIKLELELQGYVLTAVNSIHRQLLEKQQYDELLGELNALGFAPSTHSGVKATGESSGVTSGSTPKAKAKPKPTWNNVSPGSVIGNSGSTTPPAQSITIPHIGVHHSGPRSPVRLTRARDGSLPSPKPTRSFADAPSTNTSNKDETKKAKVTASELKNLRKRLSMVRSLQQRANVRLAFEEAYRPINMSKSRLKKHLAKRKVRTFLETSNARRVDMINALEIALLKEQDGLIGNGYDFGKRFVSVEEILDAEDVSNKQLKLWLENHQVETISKSKAGKISQCMNIVEKILKAQVDETIGLELVDEIQRRRLNYKRAGIDLAPLKSPIILPDGHDFNSRDGAWISLAQFDPDANDAIVSRNYKLFELLFESNLWGTEYSDVSDMETEYSSEEEEDAGVIAVDADKDSLRATRQPDFSNADDEKAPSGELQQQSFPEQQRDETKDGSCIMM